MSVVLLLKLFSKNKTILINIFYIPDIHCCDKSNNFKCRETCKRVLKTQNTIQEITSGLKIGGCGSPMPQVRNKSSKVAINK